MFSSKSTYTEDEVSVSFCGVVGLLIGEIYFAGYENQFYTFTFQRGYIKVVTNSPDEILRYLKTLSSYTVKIVNLTEKLGHTIHLNFCTSSQFEQVIISVRNSSCFFLLLSSQTGII